MLSIVKSRGLQGIEGYIVRVEADISNGLLGFERIGINTVQKV